MATSKGNYTERLAKHISNLKYDDLPADVVRQAKKVILDAVGCEAACSLLENGRLIVKFGRSLGGKREASVLGSNYKTTVVNAALVNGTLGHGDEIDESLEEAGHATSGIIPSALACGEKEGISGKEMIAAVVAGYDMAGRIRDAGICHARVNIGLGRGLLPNFWSVAAAANALKLDTTRTRIALGLVACQAGSYYDLGSEAKHMAKSLGYGVGARNGVTAALLAQMGYDGPQSIFDVSYNIFEAALGKDYDRDLLVKDLGKKFTIMETCLKLYSAGHPIHAPAFGLLKILERERLKGDDIKSILVRQPRDEQRTVDNRDMPEITVQYCLAVASYDRRLTWDQYTPERVNDPKVLDLKKRVKSVHDPKLDERKKITKAHSADVEVETKDGRRFTESVDYPPGDPGNPASQEEIEKKILYYGSKVFGEKKTKTLISTVRNLEKMEDVNELGELLRI